MPVNVVKTPADETHWNKAKEIVKKEYPDISEGSKKFYKLVMGIFKKMSKTASAEETIQVLYNENILSKEAVDLFYENQKLKEAEEIFKEADFSETKTLLSHAAKTKLPEGAMLGLGLAGSAAALAGGLKGISAIRNRMTRKKRVEEASKFDPSIKEMDPKLVDAAMKDIDRLNPEYSKSPLITGSYLKSINMWGGLNVDQANLLKDENRRKSVTENYAKGFSSMNKNSSAEKVAVSDTMKNFGKSMGDKAMSGLTNAAGAAAVTGGVVGGAMLATKLLNKFTRHKRVKEMHELYPELKKYDEKKVSRALETVERVNPSFGKDPYISGGYVKEMLKNKGVSPKTIEGLAESAGNLESYRPFSSAKSYIGKED